LEAARRERGIRNLGDPHASAGVGQLIVARKRVTIVERRG